MPDKRDILQEARDRFANSEIAEQKNRIKGVSDLRFLNGDQWPAKIRTAREEADRPCETINKLPGHIDQILGEIRQNKMSIKVLPTGKPASKAVAEQLEGLIRSIENLSKSDIVYKTGAEGAINSGRGAWRIVTDYIDDDVFDQEIRLKRIKNPYTVYFDPTAEEWDKRDGRYAFITEWVPEDEYKKRYPKADISNFSALAVGDSRQLWYKEKKVRVAEYWVKEPKKKTILLLSDGRVVEEENWAKALPELKANERVHHSTPEGEVREGPAPEGSGLAEVVVNEVPTEKRRRKVDSHEIVSYIVSGAEVISGPHPWAGKYIPIIPVWGKELNIEGEDFVRGQVRFAKGPQRMYNYERNAEIERVALAKQPPVRLTPEQIEGHEHMWNSEANFKYQLYNHVQNQPAPLDVQPPQVSTGNVQQSAIAADEIKATTSIFDASLGARSNETSGIAIRERKMQGNIANYTYLDNLIRAIWFTGEILVDLIPRIYDTERQEMILGEDDKQTEITINQVVEDEGSGATTIVNDLSIGKYSVAVSVGPHYVTKRQETVVNLIELSQAAPMVATLGADLIVSNLDFSGADELAARLRKALPPGVVEDDEPEEPKQPSPEEIKAQADLKAKEMDIKGKELDNVEKELEIEEQKLENIEKQLDIVLKTQEFKDMLKGVVKDTTNGAVLETLKALGVNMQQQ